MRAATQPRLLVLLLVVMVAAGVCARLGVWQLSRAYERGAQAEQHRVDELASQGPAWLGDVLAPQVSMGGALVGKTVTASGTYEDGGLVVAGRAHAGATGFLALAPLRVSDDGSGGESWATLSGAPVLPVVLGWAPTQDEARAALPPAGADATVTGYLQTSEAVGDGMVSDGVTDSISSGHLANVWGGPVYAGYLVLSASEPHPDPALALLDRPTLDGGDTGLNLQNLFYAVQWWIFGLFALGLWVQVVRDDARTARDEDAFTGWDALQPR